MIDAINTKNITLPISATQNQISDIKDKKSATKTQSVQNKALLSVLKEVPKNIQSQTVKHLSTALPAPQEKVNKSDLSNILNKVDPNISMTVFFELLQKFMLWMRKSTRTEFIEERSLYKQEMNKAADDMRSAAGFSMAAGIVGGAIGIAVSAVGIGGAIKAAKVDQAGMQEIGSMEASFKAENASGKAEAATSQPKPPSLSAAKLKPTNFDAAYSTKEESVTLNTAKNTSAKTGASAKTDELTEAQQQKITDIRNLTSRKSTQIMQKVDLARALITPSSQITSGGLEFSSGMQKADQTQDEALASTSASYAEQQTHLYSQAGDSISKLQQKLSSIIESDIEARRTIIRS